MDEYYYAGKVSGCYGPYGCSFASANLGPRAFYDGYGSLLFPRAVKVVDVSEFQYHIDWAKVAQTDVDAAVLRLGFGAATLDARFAENVAGCQANDIPFGVYLFSYAYDADYAALEGQFVAATLDAYELDRDIPVFFDLEYWSPWKGHSMPSSVAAYKAVVDAFFAEVEGAGYTNAYLYTGPSFAARHFNDSSVLRRVAWWAQYWRTPSDINYYGFGWPAGTAARAWQFSNAGRVSGITGGSGNVDVDVFSADFPYFASRVTESGKRRLMRYFGFVDVNATTDHLDDIEWLRDQGISEGWDNGDATRSFRPYARCARADMAAFLYRLAGSPAYEEPAASPFTDVTATTAHHKEVCWLAETGIAQGWAHDDGTATFRPGANIARADMAAFLYRLAGSPEVDASPSAFSDVNDTTPHADEIAWLAATGVSEGWTNKDGTRSFRPYAAIARADMAAFLHRMAEDGLVVSW